MLYIRLLSGVYAYVVLFFLHVPHMQRLFLPCFSFFFLESIHLYRHCVHLPCTTYVS